MNYCTVVSSGVLRYADDDDGDSGYSFFFVIPIFVTGITCIDDRRFQFPVDDFFSEVSVRRLFKKNIMSIV